MRANDITSHAPAQYKYRPAFAISVEVEGAISQRVYATHVTSTTACKINHLRQLLGDLRACDRAKGINQHLCIGIIGLP